MTAERVFRRKNRPNARSEPDAQPQTTDPQTGSEEAQDSETPKVFRRQKRAVTPGETRTAPTAAPQKPAPKPQLVHSDRPGRSAERAFPLLASDEPTTHPETSREALLAFAEDLAFPDLTVEEDTPPAPSQTSANRSGPEAASAARRTARGTDAAMSPPVAPEPDAPASASTDTATPGEPSAAPHAPLVLQNIQRTADPEPAARAPSPSDPLILPTEQRTDHRHTARPLPPQPMAPTRDPEKPLLAATPPTRSPKEPIRDAGQIGETADADEIEAIEATPSIPAPAPNPGPVPETAPEAVAGTQAATSGPSVATRPAPDTSAEARRIAVEAEPSPRIGGDDPSDIENLFAEDPAPEAAQPDRPEADSGDAPDETPRLDDAPMAAGRVSGHTAAIDEGADAMNEGKTDPTDGVASGEAEVSAADAQVMDAHAADPDADDTELPTGTVETDHAIWARLTPVIVDERVLDRHRVITATRYDPAHTAFDVLRTRLLQAVAERGWSRIAITSPTKGCGKTFTAANLAISLARQENCPTILFDADLRDPMLARTFGATSPGAIGDMLRGKTAPEDHLQRLGPNSIHAGPNLAFAFNDAREAYASELLQDPRTADTLRRIEARFAPKLMLFDTPPALYGDDVLAMRPLIDAVILVVGGGLTTANEIREVENRLGTETPLLGVVLNRAEGSKTRQYGY